MTYKDAVKHGFYELQSARDWYREVTADVGMHADLVEWWVRTAALLAFSCLAMVYGQQVGTQTAENHPKLPSQKCTTTGGCVNQNTAVVLDANWRWLHTTSGYTNCYTGNTWDASLCPDPVTCAQNCALDGADYAGECIAARCCVCRGD